MRYLLLRVFIIVLFTSQAQSVYFYKQDSTPIKNVLVANITMDESVFSDKEGKVDLTIFQDKEELLQIIHESYHTVVLPKNVFVVRGNIYLENLVNIIDQVKVTVLSKTKETTYELITQTKSISKDSLAIDALEVMQNNKIYSLVVLDKTKNPVGIIRMHDLIEAGLV